MSEIPGYEESTYRVLPAAPLPVAAKTRKSLLATTDTATRVDNLPTRARCVRRNGHDVNNVVYNIIVYLTS